MKKLLPLVLLVAGSCQMPVNRAPNTWYAVAEVVCRNPACLHCHGRSDIPCGRCGATGKLPCTKCPENGRVPCTTCKGDGRKDGKTCGRCEGKGTMVCPTCNGTKLRACGTCDGQARLTCLRPLTISETPPRGDDAWPPGNEPGNR